MFTVNIPVSPSVNNLYFNNTFSKNKKAIRLLTRRPGNGFIKTLTRKNNFGRSKTKAYREWLRQAGWEIKLSEPKPEPIVGMYTAQIVVSSKLRGDIDNRVKAVLDLLVSLGLTSDDFYCFKSSIERSNEVDIKRCIVTIREYVDHA
jgi:Holliday junction resolvase RusA-like endonuclease